MKLLHKKAQTSILATIVCIVAKDGGLYIYVRVSGASGCAKWKSQLLMGFEELGVSVSMVLSIWILGE